MPRALAAASVASAAGLTLLITGCATDLAQGYRSTPDYPAYASATCPGVAADQAMNRAAERYVERKTGMDVRGLGPSARDVRGGLLMALVFAVAEERPVDARDVCGGIAAAQSSANRRRR
ncbi:hypothetical protein [Hyphomonas sp.]|uniref:hypothetical protein n=1 Tax=Hyphomonas sp. TaxID=87 RepID=UPI00391D3F18